MEQNVVNLANLAFTPEETKTLEEYLEEMFRLRILIDAEQVEIERLKAENQELKAETRAMLAVLKATVLT